MEKVNLAWPLPAKPAGKSRHKVRRDMILVAHDLLAVWDALMVLLSGYVSAVIYSTLIPVRSMMDGFFGHGGRLVLVGALLAPFLLREPSRGAAGQLNSVVTPASRVLPRVLALLAVLLTTAFLVKIEHETPRLWACLWALLIGAGAIAGRVLLTRNVRKLEQAGMLRNRVAIVGSAPGTEMVKREIACAPSLVMDVVGVFDDGASANGATDPMLRDLVELGTREPLDLVLVAPSVDGVQDGEARLAAVLRELKALDVQIAYCPNMGGIELYGRSLDRLGEMPLIVVAHRAIRQWGLVLKEIEDKTVSALLLVALLPLLGTVAILIRLDSPGPVIFRQRRHGWNNSEFEILKFRTMTWEPRSPAEQLQQTQRSDPRVTRVGAFLRRSSLDELPQLVNVLRGDMSLVGPRPHPVVMRTGNQFCNDIVAEYAHRHRVKPGITGWAQINGYRGATETAEQVRRRVAFDIDYVEHWSIFFDLKILLLTPFKVLFDRKNAF
jgi:Undecaprenyl-phosphate glucose phosphotransferase